MRNVLVDYARARRALKRGSENQVSLDPDITIAASQSDIVQVLDLDRSLTQLEQEDEGLAQLVEMRFFAGMTAEEIADAVGRSVHIVRHDLRLAQAWLRRSLASLSE
jgi:RNA polymerase sigma factor (TIGR02999 family)